MAKRRSAAGTRRHSPRQQYCAIQKHVYVFLASPVCSSFITGELGPVIGGYDTR
jgi:hypothetical protein